MAKNFTGGNFEAKNFENAAFPGGGLTVVVPPGTDPCAGMYYAERTDIEMIFGKSNVETWADLDNLDNLGNGIGVPERICWALRNAQDHLNNRLTNGPYVIPFVQPYPAELIDACARLAGVNLYQARGAEDAEGKSVNALGSHRKLIELFIRQVLSGRSNFLGLKRTSDIPEAVVDPTPLFTTWP
jgi:phage gp36-like protein